MAGTLVFVDAFSLMRCGREGMTASSAPIGVVVVGGGVSGLVAANRAAQSGASVCVLERRAEQDYLCNTRLSGGTFHVAFQDIEGDEDQLVAAIATATHGFADQRLVRVIARHGRDAIAWLRGEGIAFTSMGQEAWQQRVLAPRITTWQDQGWRGKSGDVLLRTLEENLLRRGSRFLRGHRARRIVRDHETVTAIEAVRDDGASMTLPCNAVILADGGFQGDDDLMRAWVSPAPHRLKHRGVAAGIGDGIRMATALGAKTVGMGSFYGHILARGAMTNDALWPFPVVDFLACASIVVDRAGRRVFDEGLGGVYGANRIARLADPLETCIVFDHLTWEGPGRHFVRSPNPMLVEKGATLHRADTLAALAAEAGIDAGNLAKTVAAYNTALAQGALPSLDPPRTADWKGFDRAAERYRPHAIATAPFYALPVCAGVTFTTGGLAIDEHARVIDGDERPLHGVYAVGANIGGIEGGERCGYIGGLAKDAVFALRAGAHAAGKTPARARAAEVGTRTS